MGMAFADEMSQCLGGAGMPIGPEAIPDRLELETGLERLVSWMNELDEDARAALDEITGDYAVNALIADPSVNIAPELGPLLSAIDEVPESIPISTLAEQCQSCLPNE
jgi:hypothetical protein